jgi:hypothetical protein
MHQPRDTWSATISRQSRLGNYARRSQSNIDHNIPTLKY